MAHIVFVTYEIAPTTPGGVGVFVAAMAEALLRDGHRVTLLLDISAGELARWTDTDSRTIADRTCLRARRVEDDCHDIGVGRDAFPSEAHWRSFRFAHALAKLHAEAPVDLAEFVDYCGAAYYALIGRAAAPSQLPPRIAVRLHNTIELIDRRVACDFAPFRVHDYALERAALTLADLVLTPGQRYWDEECANLYPAVALERVQPSFPVRRAYPRIESAGQGHDVVFVGRVSTFKGLDRFLHAAVAVLHDEALGALVRRFVVIGPGETVSSARSEQDILAIAEDLPSERLLLAGRASEAEIRGYFAEAAVAVFPNRMESFCYAAHEAHLAGVPLILSDTPAFRDHFTDGQSALFFDGSVGDLVEQLGRCLTDAGLRASLAQSVERHRDRYRRHDYDRHLAVRPFAPVPCPARRLGAIIVSWDGNADEVRRTIEDLATSPAIAIWQLLPAVDGRSGVGAFGARWRILDQLGQPVAGSTQSLPPAAAFLAAGTLGAGTFLLAAAEMLAHEPRLGAVLPAGIGAEGLRSASAVPAMLERLTAPGGTLLSAVLRMAARATLADLLEDSSALTEVALLLRRRARGEVLVDHPLLGLPTGTLASPVPAGCVRAQLLRRFAWFHDPILLADELAEVAAVTRRLRAYEREWCEAGHAAAGPAPGSLVIQVPDQAQPGHAANRVTILALRRQVLGPIVSWAELSVIGSWRQVEVADRPQALLVGEGGRLELPAADDPQVTLLLGPDQGSVALAFGQRAVRLELHHPRYQQISARIRDLLALCHDVRDSEPLLPAGLLIHRNLAQELETALSQDRRQLTVIEAQADRALAQAMGVLERHEHGWVLPEDLHHRVAVGQAVVGQATAGQAAIGRAIAGVAAAHGLARVAIFGGAAMLTMIEGLLASQPPALIVHTLRPALSWQAGGWEWLRQVAELARRHAGRLRLRAAPGAALETLRLLGVPVERAPITLPAPQHRPGRGRVSLILPRSSPGVPSCGHIAAASAEVVRTGEVARLYLPHDQPHTVKILEQLGAGERVSLYEDADMLLSTVTGARFIYVCPFADASVDPLTLRLLAAGGLALTAPGPLSFADPQAHRVLEVAHWEDSMRIADHLRQAIQGYDDLVERLAGKTVTFA